MNRGRRLLWHSMLLFVLGLVTGLFPQKLANPRMGLAAHLEGLMNGTFLLALGCAWGSVRLSPRSASIAFGTALFGAYVNWATTTLAALFGTASMTPLTAGGHRGQPWQELLVAIGFATVALAMIASSVLLLAGFRGGPENDRPASRAGGRTFDHDNRDRGGDR